VSRDELVAAGAKALSDAWRCGTVFSKDEQGRWQTDYGKFATAMLDVVEPLIRADERTSRTAKSNHLVRSLMLADLRAQVEMWHDLADNEFRHKGANYFEGALDAYAAVLTLIDGATDD